MSYLSGSKRKNALAKFNKVTGMTNDATAKKILEKNRWNVDNAVNYYYDNQSKYNKVSKSKVNSFFNKYKTQTEEKSEGDFISDDELEKLTNDVGITDIDLGLFVLSYMFNASEMGCISKKEFEDFCMKERVDSISELKKVYKKKEKAVLTKKSSSFKEFYRWLFDFYKEEERKTLNKDEAIQVWSIVLKGQTDWNYQLVLNFMENVNEASTISRDLWEMVYEFMIEVKPDLSNWGEDDGGGWHSTIDDLVEHLEEQNQN